MRCSYQAVGLAMIALFAAVSAQARNDEFRAVLRGGKEVPRVTTDTRANALMNFWAQRRARFRSRSCCCMAGASRRRIVIAALRA